MTPYENALSFRLASMEEKVDQLLRFAGNLSRLTLGQLTETEVEEIDYYSIPVRPANSKVSFKLEVCRDVRFSVYVEPNQPGYAIIQEAYMALPADVQIGDIITIEQMGKPVPFGTVRSGSQVTPSESIRVNVQVNHKWLLHLASYAIVYGPDGWGEGCNCGPTRYDQHGQLIREES